MGGLVGGEREVGRCGVEWGEDGWESEVKVRGGEEWMR